MAEGGLSWLQSHTIRRVLRSDTCRLLFHDTRLSAEPTWGLLTRARRSPGRKTAWCRRARPGQRDGVQEEETGAEAAASGSGPGPWDSTGQHQGQRWPAPPPPGRPRGAPSSATIWEGQGEAVHPEAADRCPKDITVSLCLRNKSSSGHFQKPFSRPPRFLGRGQDGVGTLGPQEDTRRCPPHNKGADWAREGDEGGEAPSGRCTRVPAGRGRWFGRSGSLPVTVCCLKNYSRAKVYHLTVSEGHEPGSRPVSWSWRRTSQEAVPLRRLTPRATGTWAWFFASGLHGACITQQVASLKGMMGGKGGHHQDRCPCVPGLDQKGHMLTSARPRVTQTGWVQRGQRATPAQEVWVAGGHLRRWRPQAPRKKNGDFFPQAWNFECTRKRSVFPLRGLE